MTENKIIIFYHDDPDGIVSAKIAGMYHKDICDIVYRKINYHYNFEKEIKDISDYQTCIIVDFSFPPDIMTKINEVTELVWIDHHISAMEANPELWQGDTKGIRRTNNSGCMLTWQYYYPDIVPPNTVAWIEDLDLWKWEFEDSSKPFNEYFYMKIKEPKDSFLSLLMEHNNTNIARDFEDEFIEKGGLLLEAQMSRIKKSFEQGKDIEFYGHKTRMINTNHDQSQVGEYCYKDKGYPIAFMWSVVGSQVTVQLRSSTVDVGKLAVKNGGGGHEFASGFQTNIDEIEMMLK